MNEPSRRVRCPLCSESTMGDIVVATRQNPANKQARTNKQANEQVSLSIRSKNQYRKSEAKKGSRWVPHGSVIV